jgi:nucleoside-diphosphate-sugar epimerase
VSDLENKTATIVGNGNEKVSWTSGRDTAKAMEKLIRIPKGEWEPHIYVGGEISSWNEAMKVVEKFYGTLQSSSINVDIEFQKTYIPTDNCERILADAANPKYKTDPREL